MTASFVTCNSTLLFSLRAPVRKTPFGTVTQAENIAITGGGMLDGQADDRHWWPWKRGTNGQPSQEKDRDALFEMAERNVPVTPCMNTFLQRYG